MKVSLNTIRQYIDFELPPVDELCKRINEQLGKIETVVDMGAVYKGIVIVKVMQAEKHPNADKLSVCLVDDGGVVENVPRDDNGYVQVVCGAPNVHGDMFAIWLPPGVTVPASFNDPEPFVLSARDLRGVVSNGMLAAADELALGSDHEGIIELTDADLALGAAVSQLSPGLNFAQTFGLNDTILDIENKMFTHRPDCFGQLGVAREISGILGHKFTSPSWYLDVPEFVGASGLELTVTNEAEEKVPRFMAVALTNVTVKPSPFWLQCELVRLGSKPINNVVDSTNYVMLITAQPLHAYDYDKLAGHTLGVRMGRQGEQLPLLNGKTYEVSSDDIVIVDGEKPIGMGGVMGGGNSEVSTDTKNIVLECATFDMYTIRKTSMRHGLFTEAVTRFNKGQSPLQNPAITAYALESLRQLAGAEQASEVYDVMTIEAGNKAVLLTPTFIIERLGGHSTNAEIIALLKNVEFDTQTHALVSTVSTEAPHDDVRHSGESRTEEDAMYTTAPFWRTDIELPEDVVEEVGRLYGFDKLPRELPKRGIKPAAKNANVELKQKIRSALAAAGANEVLTYSFVHENVLRQSNQDPAGAYKLSNALSPDLHYYRLTLMPSLLGHVHANIKAGHDRFALFEIGKGHEKGHVDEAGLPHEFEYVAAVVADKKKQGAAYYEAKRLLVELLRNLGIQDGVEYVPFELNDLTKNAAYFVPNRTAVIQVAGEPIGYVGEFMIEVQKNFKLPTYSAGFELDLARLHKFQAPKRYSPLSRFPYVTQDISIKVAPTVPYAAVYTLAEQTLTAALQPGATAILRPVDIYEPADGSLKTITLRVRVTNHERTLTEAEVSSYLERIAGAAAEAYDRRD